MSKKPRKICGECGEPCPLIYSRTITKKMALGLIALVRLHTKHGSWVHVSDPALGRLTDGGDFARLAHWGLIETKQNTDTRKKSASGLWRPTALGIAFARGEVTVPYKARLKKGKCLGLDATKRRHIQESLGKEFLLAELLAAVE